MSAHKPAICPGRRHNLYFIGQQANLLFVPEVVTPYRNILNKTVHKKAMSASALKMCRNIRVLEGIDILWY